MTVHTADMSPDLLCHRCGYNLHTSPQDAKCPECGEPAAESRRAALIPRRPAWRDSDPRWRRPVLLGVWILAFMPFMDVLRHFDSISSVPVLSVFHHTPLTLDQTFLGDLMMRVDQPLLFCMGVVLLFSKERGHHRRSLESTRRWGILCSYVAFVLGAVQILFIPAMVLTGIAAMFLSMPLKYQPAVTHSLLKWVLPTSVTSGQSPFHTPCCLRSHRLPFCWHAFHCSTHFASAAANASRRSSSLRFAFFSSRGSLGRPHSIALAPG